MGFLNRYIRNEKGSYPVVMMVVLVLTYVVVSLSVMLVTEMVSYATNYQDNLENVYDVDSTFEFYKNNTKQNLSNKSLGSSEGEYVEGEIFDSADLSVVTYFVESNIQEFLADGEKVPLGIVSSEVKDTSSVENYCRRLSGTDTEGEYIFVRYSCDNEEGESRNFDLVYEVIINRNGVEEIYEVVLGNILFDVVDTGNEIRLDLSEITYNVSKK